jgi:hypothetical protein
MAEGDAGPSQGAIRALSMLRPGFAFLAIVTTFAAVSVGARPALGGTIRMTISSSADYSEGVIKVHLELLNGGNEDASAVVPIATCGGKSERGQGVRRLTPGVPFNEDIRLATGPLASGRWPCRIEVNYADPNGFPFRAPHVFLLEIGRPPPAKVLLTIPPIEPFDDNGQTSILLRSLDASPQRVSVQVFASEGLSTSLAKSPVEMKAHEEQALPLLLTNRHARAGSVLPVLVTAEYESDGYHHGAFAAGTVRVMAPRPFLARHRSSLMTAGFLTAVAGAVIALIRRRRQRAGS